VKLLIDECLSEGLTKIARGRGHPESSHVRWIGKAGAKDWELLPVILDGDWTFVTKNSVDFRGPADTPGSQGEYRKVMLHAGLICLNGPIGMDLDMQIELFQAALDALDEHDDLINRVLEVTLDTAGTHAVNCYRSRAPGARVRSALGAFDNTLVQTRPLLASW
jgi:predicted nuclease of predicted toxin-antitoxin system